MRVFISWSGSRSHDVAIALKNFIGDIIQSVTPFVSDEDIVNGERWNDRLKEELQENQYGILSITNENKESPWLLFEAGALSNSSHNIPVVPFLFDIEPSALSGSPLLQFQATIYYSKDNVKKLINNINDACGENKLDNMRLERAFERCYDEFESALKKVTPELNEPKDAMSDKTHIILEELLDLTRNNQKLLNSNDSQSSNLVEQIEQLLKDFRNKSGSSAYLHKKRKISPTAIAELMRIAQYESYEAGLLIAFSIFREDFPWIYDMGKDVITAIKSDISLEEKYQLVNSLKSLMFFSLDNPAFPFVGGGDEIMRLHDIVVSICDYLIEFVKGGVGSKPMLRSFQKNPLF
jgi:hypothetical protein